MEKIFTGTSDDAKKNIKKMIHDKKSTNIFHNLQAFLFAGGIALAFICIIGIIGCLFKKYKDKIVDYI